jgi:hypothetical protein
MSSDKNINDLVVKLNINLDNSDVDTICKL